MNNGAFEPKPVVQWRLDEMGNGRLGVHAQSQAGQRDAQLGCSDITIGSALAAKDIADRTRCTIALLRELFNARAPNGDNGKLGGDEQTVHQDQQGNDNEGEQYCHHAASPADVFGRPVGSATQTAVTERWATASTCSWTP